MLWPRDGNVSKRKLFRPVLVCQGLSLTWAAGEHHNSLGRDAEVVREAVWLEVRLGLSAVTFHNHPLVEFCPPASLRAEQLS